MFKMNLAKQVYWFLNLLSLILITCVVCQSEEKACLVRRNMPGLCTVVSNCGLALEILGKGRPHRLNRCGFTREPEADEIVCCPSSSILTVKGPDLPVLTHEPLSSHQTYCEKISKSPQAVPHIIRGKNSSEGEFPHMASLGGEDTDGFVWSVCGAAIISPNFLLTAAHCFVSRTKITKIRVGVTRINDSKAQDYNVKDVILHDNYDHGKKHNDIALVKVDGELKFNDAVFPACLFSKNEDPTNQTITGWGVMQAAHCFVSRTKITKIRVGVTRINDSKAQDYNVKDVILHDNYDHGKKHNDIALVKVDGACLFSKNEDPTNQTITGWGVMQVGQDDKATVLQKAVVFTYDRGQCQQIYANRSDGLRRIVDTQFCATSPPGETLIVDACKGDSGGPGQIKNEFGTYSIVGIVSFGQACGGKVPGVYTKVAPYVEWIEKKVWSRY